MAYYSPDELKVGSKAFSLNTTDLKKIAKAFALQVVAIGCVYAVAVIQSAEMPTYLLGLVPTVSTAFYAVSRWATDRSENLYRIKK